eukprot:642525-Pelagomonas_calceolata.AAC.1
MAFSLVEPSLQSASNSNKDDVRSTMTPSGLLCCVKWVRPVGYKQLGTLLKGVHATAFPGDPAMALTIFTPFLRR